MDMHTKTHALPTEPDVQTRAFYLRSLAALDEAGVPYVVGGGYAMAYHTGIVRNTKDLDLFVTRLNRDWALRVLRNAGYRVEMTWPHFLCKALHNDSFIDILYDSANGLCPVDDKTIEHAQPAEILGRPVPLCPPEEMIWSKAYVMDRDRFDGADIAHLILACGDDIDWNRLISRFVRHEQVLLAHLLLFDYSYPSERQQVPEWVVQELMQRVQQQPCADEKICQGTFLAKDQYHYDVNHWGYADARLAQNGGPLTGEELKHFLST
jgi:hypothetical protein